MFEILDDFMVLLGMELRKNWKLLGASNASWALSYSRGVYVNTICRLDNVLYVWNSYICCTTTSFTENV